MFAKCAAPMVSAIIAAVFRCEWFFEKWLSSDFYNYYCCYCKCSICFLTKIVEQIKPVKYYKNLKDDKQQLIKEQKNKAGVYCLVNLKNGNIYIGSSINISVRMRNYLNTTFLKHRKNKNMPITQALLKYGQESFAVLILEYVPIDKLSIRETYYITQLLPYYNVLKQGYSSIGFKHSDSTKEFLSKLARSRKHSDETKILISRGLAGKKNPFYNKNHSVISKLKMIEANSAYPVYIYNSFKILLVIFPSVNTLTKLIKSNHSTIVSYIKKAILFRGEWYFRKSPYNLSDIPLICNWSSNESNNIMLDIINNSHIKRAIFVYDTNKNFIRKFEGVNQAQKELNINHDTIKRFVLLNKPYKGYIFSYERLSEVV